jgi:hypothetical protein
MTDLVTISLENGTPLELAMRHPDAAKAMVRAAEDTFGLPSRLAARMIAPLTDRLSREWLVRQNNPYLAEIDAIAQKLGIAGVHSLNVCFEWGCTGGIWPSADGPVLRRVLDWPFPGLGESQVVLRQPGDAGSFFNIGWPGMVGVVQGLAPGRFAAAIHQAPMRKHGGGLISDWWKNRLATRQNRGLPPVHLLRSIFEHAADYAAAKTLLSESEIAVPAIFLLSGPGAEEGCIIERTETTFAVREMGGSGVFAANHFDALPGEWRARPIDSAGRDACARGLKAEDFVADFRWFAPPIANINSRAAFNACARTGALALMGTAGTQPSTRTFRLP